MENDANKNELRRIIKVELSDHMNLKDVIRTIEEEVHMKITSTIDKEFIESEYVICCKEFLLDEIKRFILKLNHKDVPKILLSLHKVSRLSKFECVFQKKLLYYNLLSKHIFLISNDDQESLTKLLKNTCLQEIYVIMDTAKDQLIFLERFVDFLSRTFHFSYVLRETHLRAFCYDELGFSQFAANVLNLHFDNPFPQFTSLCDSARLLKDKNNLVFMDLIKQELEPYTRPIKIQEVQMQNSTMLRISGMNVLLSDITAEIESKIKRNPKIEEINFVVDRIFHIDDSLNDKSLWHGKNISCVSKVINVTKSGLEWDVSGIDNDHVYAEDCGMEITGDGKNGADGFAGESGGNISILGEEMINPKYLTITSNGGNGSKGQDGGNGRNGKDGSSIRFHNFESRFPTTALYLGWKRGDAYSSTLKAVESDVDKTQIYSRGENEDTYVQGTTSNGNTITFSHTEPRWNTVPQSFLLYKGALGSIGRPGGQGGLGGEGGYAGQITLQVENNEDSAPHNICIQIAKQGENGEDGKGGLYGMFGKNGWDVAWMDYMRSGWPKYYGKDENSNLRIEFYNSNSSERVFCAYKENSAYKYAGITTSRLEHSKMKKFEERKSTKRQRSELEQQARTTRKNAILGQSMKAEFSRIKQLDSKSKYANLQSEMQRCREAALQDITATEEKELTQSFQVKVMRNTRFEGTKRSRQCRAANRKKFVNMKATNKSIGYNEILRKLEKLESELNSEDHVGSIQELVKQNHSDRLVHLDICCLSLLRKIAKELPVYYPATLTPMIDVSARRASRYLVETNEDISESITHRTLGTLRQYLQSDLQGQRENVTKFLKQIQNNREVKKILKSPLREFVLETGGAEIAHGDLKKFYNFYKFHLTKLDNGFIGFPEAIDEYCVDNANVYESFLKYILDHGCKSKIYLNLLAYVFNLNIRVYCELKSNDFDLLLDLNPSAKGVLYLSQKFERLTLNDHLQQLFTERRLKCIQYQKIIMDVQTFHTSSEFQNYFVSKNFLNKNHYSEDKIEEFYRQHYANESDAVNNIAENFPKNFEMEKRIQKLTYLFSGQRGILYFMEKHFAHEAIRVSVLELDYIVNYVINYAAENSQSDTEMFLTWIIAAYDQENWIDEVILLELEEFFGTQLPNKTEWRAFLSEIGNKTILIAFGQQLKECSRDLTVECIEEILRLLSKIPNQEVTVDELELNLWPYVLRNVFWTFMLSKIAHWANDEELENLCYHIQIIENNMGNGFANKLLNALKGKVERHQDVMLLSQKGFLSDLLRKISSQAWMLEEKHLKQLESNELRVWFDQMELFFAAGTKERSLQELTKIIRRNVNTSKRILTILPQVETSIRLPDYKHAKSLSSIDNVILEKRKYRLRDTQKLAVLLLLKNEHSTLAQVSTGEGKTLIVVTAALIKALDGEKVDIVTSSSVLARRDADINSDIYKHFKIGVSHNCSDEIEARKTAYSSSKVVYGELSNFQRDYLLDNFYGKNILGKRNFGQVNVIVDEVDSMLLDKGNNMLYLSHDLPGMDKLESVYIFIWSWLCKPKKAAKCFDAEAIREAILRDLFGLITVDDITQIDVRLSKLQASKLWSCLIDGKIVDQMGKLIVDRINDDTVKKILPSEFSVYIGRVLYLIEDCLQRQRRIHLPNYLRGFVERHLDAWIQSAFYAFFMSEGVDYVVDVDRTGAATSSRSPQIIILDKGTGTDQTSSQWDEGLHQFLQLKHNCKITLQSLKAVFTSNVSFFKLYKNLYGLTGTLGSHVERNILTDMHNVDFFTIPTAKVKQLEELHPIVCCDSEGWAHRIHNETKKLIQVGRSVLIIAETVKDAEALYNTIRGNARLYTREFDEFNIVKGTEDFSMGQVIIATNLAGRGTDIKISEKLRQAGGLHVILAYLPENVRIEEQAYGRTARCGEKGTAQLIIIDPQTGVKDKRKSNIFRLKNERDHEEVRRLSEIRHYYDNQIKLEEHCFKKFKETYDDLRKYIISQHDTFFKNARRVWSECTEYVTGNETAPHVDPELMSILLDAVLEKWAFWLDSNSKLISNCANDACHKEVTRMLEEFLSTLRNLKDSSEGNWVSDSPIQTVKLGLYNVHKLSLKDRAISLFNRVIKMEPSFSDPAHYYKAFVLIKKKNVSEFKTELRKTMRILNQHSYSAQLAGATVDTLKMENKQSILQIDAYKQQQAAFAHIYELILNSIQGIFGHPVDVKSLIDNNIPIDEAYEIFEKLSDRGILTKPRVERFQDETVQKIALEYSSGELKEFLRLRQGIDFETENSFRKELKKNIILPSRELFFQSLVRQKVLHNESKLVSFEMSSLETLHPELGKMVKRLMSANQLCHLKVKSSDIFLSATTPKAEYILVDRGSLKKGLGTKWYMILKQSNILEFHYKAEIIEDKLSSAKFSNFDSLSINDFKKVNIAEPEAAIILNGLVKRGIIRKRHADSVYEMNMSFEEMSELQLLPDYPVYETATYNLLRICFIYRQELERLKSQLIEKVCHIQLGLLSKPHNNLLRELIQNGVLIPRKVSDKSLDEIEKILKKLFPDSDSKNRIIVIQNILSSSKATLETLETPDGNLKPLTGMCTTGNLGMAEEFYRFSYNGYEQLVELVETKWSTAMITRSAWVTAIGLSQVALGAMFQLVPIYGNVAGAQLIQQGVGDLMFLTCSAFSGHLTWSDYIQHKIWSAAIAGVTLGIGACFKTLSSASAYGQKLAGPGLKKGGEKIAEMAGNNLIKAVGKRSIAKAIAINILKEAGTGIANGVWNSAVSFAIEKCLKEFCNYICSSMTAQIRAKIDGSGKIFEDIYKNMGSKKGTTFIKNTTDAYIKQKKTDKEVISKTMQLSGTLFETLRTVANKKHEKDCASVLKTIRMAIFAIDIVCAVTLMNDLTHCFLGYLRSQLNKPSKCELKTIENPEAFVQFKTEVSSEVKEKLLKEMQAIFFEKIATPLVTMGTDAFKDYAIKQACNMYQNYKNDSEFKKFQQAKNNFEIESGEPMENSERDQLNKTYEKKLQKLMCNSTNPDLIAAIIREDMPMDMTCVIAAANVIGDIMECPVKLIANAHDNFQQEATSDSLGDQKHMELHVKLTDNHFESETNDKHSTQSNNSNQNDCLYQSLPPEVRQKISPETFRERVAAEIQNNPNIRNYIEMGYHKITYDFKMFGGRQAVKFGRHKESLETDIKGNLRVETDKSIPCRLKTGEIILESVTKKETHIEDRFTRSIEFINLLLEISLGTGIPINKIIEAGKSEYQDASSMDKNYHRAHVIRAGKITTMLDKYPDWKKKLQQYIGHTQLVDKVVNYGVGLKIDTLQSQLLQQITQSGAYQCEKFFNDYKRKYIRVLERSLQLSYYKSKPEAQKSIKIAINNIRTSGFSHSRFNGRRSSNSN